MIRLFSYGSMIGFVSEHITAPSQWTLPSGRLDVAGLLGARSSIANRSMCTIFGPVSTSTSDGSTFALRLGHRTILAIPLLREGEAIGAIAVRRTEVKPFTDKQIELVSTFADQAVIAIENVRLFEEVQARNRELTEALEQQTASSEILREISGSQTDIQPVFDTIVENAVRLCEAERAFIFRFDGELLRAVAYHNVGPELREFVDGNPIT